MALSVGFYADVDDLRARSAACIAANLVALRTSRDCIAVSRRLLNPYFAVSGGSDRGRPAKKVRARAKGWPPSWDTFRQDAILVAVRRIGYQLSLTVRHGTTEQVALLDKCEPPLSLDAVEAALRDAIGLTMREVGEIWGGVKAAPRDPLGF